MTRWGCRTRAARRGCAICSPAPAARMPARRGARAKPALTREPLQALLDTCDDSLRARPGVTAVRLGQRRSAPLRSRARLPSRTRRAAGRFSLSAAPLQTNQAGAARPTPSRSWERRRGPAGLAGCQRHRARPAVPPDPARRCAGRATGRRRRARYRAPALRAGGLDNYSAHSLRSGFITEAGRQQVPLGDAMAMTATPAWPRGYYRAGAAATRRPPACSIWRQRSSRPPDRRCRRAAR